jgi:metal-responsive CopG/Arc/MetJ family transcriptional regulator
MTTQVALRLDDDLADQLDVLVINYEDLSNRSEAIRIAITEFVQRRQQALIDEQIVAGYTAVPQADDIDEWGSLAQFTEEASRRTMAALDAEDGGW